MNNTKQPVPGSLLIVQAFKEAIMKRWSEMSDGAGKR